jgi:hypothetical protein
MLGALLPVELSNWNGKDIRTMAIEVEMKDIYDVTYSPLSADAHAEWMTLRSKYLRPCEESAHLLHWLPIFRRAAMDLSIPHSATTCLQQSVKTALNALNLPYREVFWRRIETRVTTAVKPMK